MIHEDERRILEVYPEAKLIMAKKDCIVGNHYHKKKTEVFYLIEGDCLIKRNGIVEVMDKGEPYFVLPNCNHSFDMTEGSIMICLCSHVYDSQDDYKS